MLIIMIVSSVVMLSFYRQNVNGFIYLAFYIAVYAIYSKLNEYTNSFKNICNNMMEYKSLISYLDILILTTSFTWMYLCMPMYLNNHINYWVFSLNLILYVISCTLMFIILGGCNITLQNKLIIIISTTLIGLISSILIIVSMYYGGSGKYLFFNDTTDSSNAVCYQPSKQTFKCQMYKNGELITNL